MSTLLSLLPFDVPFLGQDAGPLVQGSGPIGSVDASGYFDDAGFAPPAEGEACEPSQCGDGGGPCCREGLVCVDVTTQRAVCMRPCVASCETGSHCTELAAGSFCLPLVGRGQRCESAACDPDGGTTCMTARAETTEALAFACQIPCAPGADAGRCPEGDECLLSPVGELEVQGGGSPVACDVSACGVSLDGGAACACDGEFECVPFSDGGICARPRGVCGTEAPLGDPALLGQPASWPEGGTCDPGEGQRYCGLVDVDGGGPVYCEPGSSSDLVGLCIAVCRDPSAANGPVTYACPAGFVCNSALQRLYHVPTPDRACEDSSDCHLDDGEVCAGPLAAYGYESRCAIPYALCQPVSALDAGN